MPAVEIECHERWVFRYRIGGKTAGLLVAQAWGEGFFLEDVVTFPKAPLTALLGMLEAGYAEVVRRGGRHLGIYQPRRGMDPRLRTLAKDLGFVKYKPGPKGMYLVKEAA